MANKMQDFSTIGNHLDEFVHLSNRYINSNISEHASEKRFSEAELDELPSVEDCPYISDSLVMQEDGVFMEGMDSNTVGGVKKDKVQIKKVILGVQDDMSKVENYSVILLKSIISSLKAKGCNTVHARCLRSKSIFIPSGGGSYLDSSVVAGSYISRKIGEDKKLLIAIKSGAKIHTIKPEIISVGGGNPINVSYISSKKVIQNNVLVFDIPKVFYTGDTKGQRSFQAYQIVKRAEHKETFFPIPIVLLNEYKECIGKLNSNWNSTIPNLEKTSANIVRVVKRQCANWREELDSTNNFNIDDLTDMNKVLYNWDTDGIIDYLFSRVTNIKVGVGKNLGDQIEEQIRRSFKTVISGT